MSHRGALSARQRGSLLLADNSGWILAGHVTPLLRFGAMTAGSARACRARRERGGSEEQERHVFSALKMEIPYDEGRGKHTEDPAVLGTASPTAYGANANANAKAGSGLCLHSSSVIIWTWEKLLHLLFSD